MLQHPGLTRRGLLMLAGGAGVQSRLRLYAGSSDFWNKKEPAEWSADEIDKLVTKSPWARQVTASSAALSRQDAAPALASTCSGFVAPAITDATPSWAKSQATARSRRV